MMTSSFSDVEHSKGKDEDGNVIEVDATTSRPLPFQVLYYSLSQMAESLIRDVPDIAL